MGRPSDEFWSLTYREIFACVESFFDGREEQQMLFGTLIAAEMIIASQGNHTFTWTDIFKPRKEQGKKQQHMASLEETRKRWQQAFEVAGSNR